MPLTQLHCPHLLLLLLVLSCLPEAPSAQVMDFLFEKWKLYSDQCHHNLSLLPPPTGDFWSLLHPPAPSQSWSVTEPSTSTPAGLTPLPTPLPTFPAPGTYLGTTKHRLVFKRCGPDGQWVRGPRGQPWRNASQCQLDDEEIEVQAGSVLVIDWLLKTRYSQKIGDDLSVSVWLSDGAMAGCRVATVIMQYGIIANYCWLLVEGVYLYSLLSLATFSERSFFSLYLGIGWGAPLLFVIPWVVVKCLFENVQCWTSNDNMGFWWILRIPVFLALLINFFIFVHIIHLLVAKLRAHQMHYADYKFRLARSTLTLIPLLGVHEVVFAFVTDEHAQGTLRSTKLFFDLFLSSFQGLLVAVLYCFLNKEVQAELMRRWRQWQEGKALQEERLASSHGSHMAPAGPCHGDPCEKLQLMSAGSSSGTGCVPSMETSLASSLPRLADSPT
ncbi:glucagon receptor isoform X5 [Mus musculus]|uniref:glucagon receptor isoform X5 n=1 Tax=Mus musculus TaxID=10090 RepID=UPI0003D6EFE0|nr:glucagon receptor isoform X5 [Mus musculus]|eukprot:XP_017169758.1 PREDICTED: glucagon receptor isoform X5 [Mus musculus]